MSPEAVLRRIEICGELSDACRKLARATPGKAEAETGEDDIGEDGCAK